MWKASPNRTRQDDDNDLSIGIRLPLAPKRLPDTPGGSVQVQPQSCGRAVKDDVERVYGDVAAHSQFPRNSA